MSKERKVDLKIEMSIVFQVDCTLDMSDGELAELAVGEARDQLRVGQETAGYWSAQLPEDIKITATKVHPTK